MSTDPRALADLVEARAKTDTGFLTYRGMIASRPSKNYVMLIFGGGSVYGDRLVGYSNMLTWEFRALCVGYTDSETLWVANRIRGLYVNWRPIPDRASGWFVEQEDDAPLLRDESMINDTRYSVTLRYRLTTPRST